MSSGSAQIWPIIAVKVSSFHISPRYVKMSIETTVNRIRGGQPVQSRIKVEDALTVAGIIRDCQKIGLKCVEAKSLQSQCQV